MAKQIHFNAFEMNCVVYQSPGLWTHPRDCADRYTELADWTELARLLERRRFDAIFLAEVHGVYAVTPETFVDIVDLLVPELPRRGVYPRDDGTLREKLYGAGRSRLQPNHPAAGYQPRVREHATVQVI
ncbi:MAG TPA: hypothetical protein VEK55_15590 [Xanthobacteraceae bacterium]|nr:hypothetical protein [Xanthobacteraceae bacterium]